MKNKKKLLLVAGAGASVEFGMPSVGEVQSLINERMQQFYPLACCPHTNLYQHIADVVSRYWNDVVPNHLRRETNFEDMLYTIFALAAAYPSGMFTSPLGALIEVKKLPEFHFQGLEVMSVDGHQLHSLASLAVDTLLDEFRGRSRSIQAEKKAELADLKEFIGAIRDEFLLSVVTLNYDNVIYGAMGDVEVGFDESGHFSDERILNRREWPCMLHLHGSVHFDMRAGPSGNLHEICWQRDVNAQFSQNASGRSTVANSEGIEFPTSVIVAGYGKTLQLQKRPFRTYYSELDRLVANCDALLYVGYGFGDAHLNQAFDCFRDNRRRPISIVTFAADDALTASGANWEAPNISVANNLDRIKIPLNNMEYVEYCSPGFVKDLKDKKKFETCFNENGRVALWYGGMLAACTEPDKVIATLI